MGTVAINADLFCEFGEDFLLDAGGDLISAIGWDLTRQAIEYFILTNPQLNGQNNTPIPADNIFDPTYGLGARADIGEPFDAATIAQIEQKLYEGIMNSPNVDPEIPPTITYTQPTPFTLIFTAFVTLLNGQQESIQLSLP